MIRKATGDPWIDHGIGYVLFASKEKFLFRAVNDEKHIACFKKYGDAIWNILTESLADYLPFRELSEDHIQKVQLTRWLFAHGLAFQVSNPPPGTWDKKSLITVMQEGSLAILDGIKTSFIHLNKTSEIKEDEMSEIDPRKMALQIAGLRASETHLPEDERVFFDPYAEYFLTDEMRAGLKNPDDVRAALSQYEQMMPGVNGAIVARIRFIDEVLLEGIATGLQQLVIIGAGYDTRAYRFEAVKDNLKVFEVDHPITQQVKVEKIKDIFGSLPDHVAYAPVVFGSDRFDQKLMVNGYNPKLKTLYIVEGLLMYIPPPVVDGLLGFIVNASGPGSAIVADYFSVSVIDGTSPLKEAQMLRQFVEREGASLQFGIEEEKLEMFFRERGFHDIQQVSSALCKERYFINASCDRPVSPIFNFVHAAISTRE